MKNATLSRNIYIGWLERTNHGEHVLVHSWATAASIQCKHRLEKPKVARASYPSWLFHTPALPSEYAGGKILKRHQMHLETSAPNDLTASDVTALLDLALRDGTTSQRRAYPPPFGEGVPRTDVFRLFSARGYFLSSSCNRASNCAT